jgi:hypothetical protein
VCLVVSTYTRQTGAIPAAVAAYVWLWQQGRGRHANILLVAVVSLGALTAAALQVATGGGFLFHVVTATASPLSLDQLWNLGRRPIVLIPGLLAAAAAASFAGIRYALPGWGMVAGYVLASAVMSLTVAKVGSAQNYFLDLSAACAFAAGMSAHWLRRWPVLLTVFALCLVPQMIWMGFKTWPYAPIESRLRERANYERLESLVRGVDGPVLADEASGLVIVTGHEIDFHPFPMSQLIEAGHWDPAPFIDRLARHHYQVILLRMSIAQPQPIPAIWTGRLAEALQQHYAPAESFRVDRGSAIVVYRPRADDGQTTAAF